MGANLNCRHLGLLSAAVLALSGGPALADWKDGERKTIAYFWDREGYRELVRVGYSHGERDPDGFRDFAKPERLERVPFESRFLREGDEMWLVTTALRRLSFFGAGTSWAVYNATTQRLVVHGTVHEHWKVEVYRERFGFPVQVEIASRLVRVRCREIGGVDWTAAEVRKRGSDELIGVRAVLSDGGQLEVEVGGEEGARASLQCEAMVSANRTLVDLKLLFRAAFAAGEEEPMQELSTGVTLYADYEVFVELGSGYDDEHTLLLGLTAQVQHRNGSPVSESQVAERPGGPDSARVVGELRQRHLALGDGLYLGAWRVPETFRRDIETGGQERVREERRIDPPPEIPGVRKDEVFDDIGDQIRDCGIDIPKSGWVIFHPESSQMLAKLDEIGISMLDQLVEPICSHPPRLVRTSVSLVEWSGDDPAPGSLPAGMRRLARAGSLSRPGTRHSLMLGRATPEGALQSGIGLEVAPDIGTSYEMVDLRYALEVRTRERAKVTSAAAFVTDRPRLLPVGRRGGKSLGVVWETRVTDAAGETIRWEE